MPSIGVVILAREFSLSILNSYKQTYKRRYKVILRVWMKSEAARMRVESERWLWLRPRRRREGQRPRDVDSSYALRAAVTGPQIQREEMDDPPRREGVPLPFPVRARPSGGQGADQTRRPREDVGRAARDAGVAAGAPCQHHGGREAFGRRADALGDDGRSHGRSPGRSAAMVGRIRGRGLARGSGHAEVGRRNRRTEEEKVEETASAEGLEWSSWELSDLLSIFHSFFDLRQRALFGHHGTGTHLCHDTIHAPRPLVSAGNTYRTYLVNTIVTPSYAYSHIYIY